MEGDVSYENARPLFSHMYGFYFPSEKSLKSAWYILLLKKGIKNYFHIY